jgi:hypothetical protein
VRTTQSIAKSRTDNAGFLAAFSFPFILLTFFFAVAASPSAAAEPPTFWTKCPTGSATGQCVIPRGIGVDATTGPTRGHLYIADQVNRRVNEFTAWGEFIKSWGWDVVESGPGDDTTAPEDQFEVCVSANGDFCKEGIGGGGTGQFFGPPGGPPGVAVDANGDVYVIDDGNYRMQKFDSEGNFLLMFGGNVNKTKSEEGGSSEAERNLCTAASGDVCQAGSKGTGKGQFGELAFGSYMAVGPAGTVYVGDEKRIQEFGTDGHYLGDLPDPDELLKEGAVQSLAVDPGGDLLVALQGKPDVHRLDPLSGAVLDTLKVDQPTAIAIDTAGNVYVFDPELSLGGTLIVHRSRILEFDSDGEQIGLFAEDQLTQSTGIATGSACFTDGLGIYASNAMEKNSFVRAYGPIPDPALCEPPKVAPEIAAQYAISAGTTEATLGAEINAHYFTGAAGSTRYRLQYGTAACVEAGWEAACVKEQPTAPGAKLGGEPSDDPQPTAGVFLTGLTPGAAYRYRFVVEGRDRLGEPTVEDQPVIGLGGKPGIEGQASTFRTFAPPEPSKPCANDAFRTGAGGFLPDCRAYEMVSPIDKAGGDIVARVAASAGIGRLDQSALAVPAEGAGLTYSSYRAFGAAQSAPFASQYLARRSAGGWQSEPLSPPQEGGFFPNTFLPMINNNFKHFSADLSEGWLATYTEPVLAAGGQAGFANLYRRDLEGGGYEACTTSEPQGDTRSFETVLQGVSADGRRAIFRAADALTLDANPPEVVGKATNFQLYACDFEEGKARSVRLVSVLPDGTASALQNAAGGASSDPSEDFGRQWTLGGAISRDGNRVFWTGLASPVDAFGPGSLYVRVNPGEEESAAKDGEGNCLPEAQKACTIALSPGAAARFWGAAANGSKALYATEAEAIAHPKPSDLYEFDVEAAEGAGEARTLIAHKSLGVLGFSGDASRVYFASEDDLDGAGAASAGKPNLYLYEAGPEPTYTFIGPLSPKDSSGDPEVPSPVHTWANQHTARVSPGGGQLVFMSDSGELAQLAAGYDNTDLVSGEADLEVYRYGAEGGQLACISCNPSGARPAGRAVKLRGLVSWQAARIPGWESSIYPTRTLSDDGSRVFFESFEALVLADTNGKADVYEWEEAGAGGCEEGDAAFVESSGGCLYLISAGTSDADSEFVDASADGQDVFVRTAQSLAPQDPGLFDIYDARAGGGFAPPPSRPAACEGEACQSPLAAPNDPTPASASFEGAGNLVAGAKPGRCAKGKARRKGRCVAKKHGKRAQQRRANHNRRAAR